MLRSFSQYIYLDYKYPSIYLVKSTMIYPFDFSSYFYHASWNVNYLAISSSTYFFTAFSATVLSSFAIGTVLVSSYSARGSWINKINLYQPFKENYSNSAAVKTFTYFSSKEIYFTLIKYKNHNSVITLDLSVCFHFSCYLLRPN